MDWVLAQGSVEGKVLAWVVTWAQSSVSESAAKTATQLEQVSVLMLAEASVGLSAKCSESRLERESAHPLETWLGLELGLVTGQSWDEARAQEWAKSLAAASALATALVTVLDSGRMSEVGSVLSMALGSEKGKGPWTDFDSAASRESKSAPMTARALAGTKAPMKAALTALEKAPMSDQSLAVEMEQVLALPWAMEWVCWLAMSSGPGTAAEKGRELG